MTPDRYRQILEQSDAKVRAQAEAAYAALLKRIRVGEAPQPAIAAVMRGFNAGVTSDLAKTFSALLATSIGTAEMRDWKVGGVKLSDRLYSQAKAVSATTRTLIEDHMKGPHSARELAKALYEGYDFKADPLNVAGKLETLPNYLKVEFNKAQAARLKTPALRAAYLQAIRQAEAGKGMDELGKVLKTAFYERNRYYANRIARTELHRAYTDQQSREFMAESWIEYVQLRMSSKHPKTDICDYHAKADLYGLGAGVYPKANAPKPPFHPHCFCLLSPKIDLSPKLKPKFNPKAERLFLASLPPNEARQVAGSIDKRDRILAGKATLEEVYNEGKDELYQWKRVGDIEMNDAIQKRDRLFEDARRKVVEHGMETGNERLVLLDAKTGEMLEAANGVVDKLILTDTMKALIQDANNSICLIHNHPGSSSFSKEDIRAASLPGANSIEAIGHDGSRYKTKPKVTDYVELGAKITVVQDVVMGFLSEMVSEKRMPLDAAGQVFHHVINLVLAKIGVIDYDYQLSSHQKKIIADSEIDLDKIIDKAVKKLKVSNPFNQESTS